MRFLALLILIAIMRAASYASVHGCDSIAKDTTIVLKEVIVVTAQRMEANASAVPDAIGLLDRDQVIRLAPLSTPDVVASIPGVWMQKTNQGGGSPFIRGLTGYHALLLTDGIRFNNSTFRSGPNQYLSTIDPLTLQRVEILRGQGSVQYGSDAIGGVAQLFFREPEFSPDKFTTLGRVYAQYMNHEMEYSGRAEMELGSKKIAVLGGIAYKSLGDIKAGGNLGTLTPTGFDENSWDIKTKAKLANLLVTAAWQHLVQHDIPLYHQIASGTFSRYHFNPQQRDLGYVRLESFHDSKLFTHVRYTVAYLHSLEVREKQRTANPVFHTDRDEVNTWHGAVEFVSEFSSHWKASSGAEFYHDRVESSAVDKNQITNENVIARGLYPDGTTYTNLAIFSVHAMDVNRFSISLGGRYNLVRLNVIDPAFGKTVVKPKALVGNVGVVFKVAKEFHLLTSVSTGFRAPNVNDVASFGVADYRYEVPNYSLQPEKSFQYQVGFRTQFKKWRAEVFVYRNHLTDLISNITSTYKGKDSLEGFKVYKKGNVNKATIKGIETEINYQLFKWLTAFGNITYTLGDNETQSEPLSRIPPLFGRVGADLKFSNAIAWRTEFLLAGKQDRLSSGDKADSRIKPGGTPGWCVMNTRLEYQYQNFRINAGIQNIFNKAYRIHGSGVDGIGRSCQVAMIIQF